MKNALQQTDPTGRVDVLMFRIAERIANRFCPREWPVFRPLVEQYTKQRFGPKRPRRRKAA